MNSSSDIAQAIEECGRIAELMQALCDLYAQLDAEIAASGAVCLGGGTCCRFDLAGHRLYLSTGELALLSAQHPPRPERAAAMRCPYQLACRCTAREARPLGCRIFFCASQFNDFCHKTYEVYHGRIRRLHDIHCAPYGYVELTAGLAAGEAAR